MKKAFENINAQILPDEDLAKKVLEQVKKPNSVVRGRPMMLVAVVMAMVLMVTPVMATNSAVIAELMYNVSPEMAARFMPVAKYVEKHGIKMEVVSASFHGATAEICVAFKDLEGDRIQKVFSAVSVSNETRFRGMTPFVGNGSQSSTITNKSFDPETGVYMMVFTVDYSFYSELLGRNMTINELFNGKITFCVDEIQWQDENGTVGRQKGPWMIGIDIEECDYEGETIPNTTSPAG